MTTFTTKQAVSAVYKLPVARAGRCVFMMRVPCTPYIEHPSATVIADGCAVVPVK